jgi:hypothetical protein
LKHHRVKAARQRQRQKRWSGAGTVIRCAAFLLLVIGCVLGSRWLRDETHSYAEGTRPANLPGLSTLGTLQPGTIQARNRRVVYPYSVVPGGVRSADELESATAHDPLVAEHYKGFDYKRARLIQVNQPKLVYLSYRRGDHIYWTRKQASLKVGEKLLTDGRMTARTRCGNQVSVLPQAETSPQEPTIAELDRPDAVASGREDLFPSNLSTDLMPLDPQLPLGSSPGNAFSGGPPPTGFMPPPIGGGSGPITTPIGGGCPPNTVSNSKDCQHNPPPPPVPEPGTVVLMVSGTAALIARYRYKR